MFNSHEWRPKEKRDPNADSSLVPVWLTRMVKLTIRSIKLLQFFFLVFPSLIEPGRHLLLIRSRQSVHWMACNREMNWRPSDGKEKRLLTFFWHFPLDKVIFISYQTGWISNCDVVNTVNSVCLHELLHQMRESSRSIFIVKKGWKIWLPRMKDVVIFRKSLLISKLITSGLGVLCQISAFREQKQNKRLVDIRIIEVMQQILNMGSVSFPFSVKENKTRRLHRPGERRRVSVCCSLKSLTYHPGPGMYFRSDFKTILSLRSRAQWKRQGQKSIQSTRVRWFIIITVRSI